MTMLNGVLDAEESLYTQNQLTHVSNEVIKAPIPARKCRMHIPMATDTASPADNVIETHTYNIKGKASILTSISGDWPRVEMVGSPRFIPVHPIGNEYSINFQEVRASLKTGMNISAEKGIVANEIIAKTENEIAYLGDANVGLSGLLTYPTTPRIVSDIQITDEGVTAKIKLDRLNSWVNEPFQLAEFEVTAVLFSKKDFKYLNTTPRSDTDNTTLMELFRKGNPTINFVDWCSQCEGVGVNGSDVAIFYVRDPRHVVLHVPQDFEELPVDDRGTELIVKCHERFAGVEMKQPLSAVIVENL